MHPLASLLSDGPIASLHFHTGGDTSRSARAFIEDLTKLLTATGATPLICTSDHELTSLFRFYQRAELKDSRGLELYPGSGLRFSDLDNMYTGGLNITTQYGDVNDCNIEIPDGGQWLDKRTPDSTARHSLPVYDTGRVSREIEALMQRWSSKLVDATEKHVPEKSAVQPRVLDISCDPLDWDPADPRRKNTALVETVRRLRRAVIGHDSRETLEGSRARALDVDA